MPGLVLKLGPNERVLINGVVMENGGRRTRLTILSDDAKILRLRDAIHPDEVDTPVKRVCYVAQLAVAGETAEDEASRQVQDGVRQLLDVFCDADSVAKLKTAAAHAAEMKFYPCMKILRDLLDMEKRLLSAPDPMT